MAEPVSHQLDVYGAWLHLATDRGQWKQLKKSTGLDLSRLNSIVGLVEQHVHGKTDQLALCVYVDAHQSEHDLLDTCAHEATHAAGMLLDHIGDKYDGHSEPLAYLVGWITAWLWDSCK